MYFTAMAAPWARMAARIVENPFAEDGGDWTTAARRLLALDVTPAALPAARTASDDAILLGVARTLALARLHARPAAEELRRLPERWFARSGWSRDALVRVVAAALRCQGALDRLAGSSASLRAVRARAWSLSFGRSLLDANRLERVLREHDVLVTGETGTGKEAVAHAVALGTPGPADGREAPFFALNIAAIPETLIESELFGHVRGAFTGAGTARPGHIRNVASGCLFLDEVGDLPPTAQSKLLRVMETDRVTPLGSETSYAADVRYIAATHKDLRAMVESGAFRQDLYERLAGHVIRLPPLRERPEDLLPIGVEFVERYLSPSAPEWKGVRAFLASRDASSHSWPGNVRELHNCLRNVMLGIDPGLAPDAVTPDTPSIPKERLLPAPIAAGTAPLAEVETWYVKRVLERSDHNYARAARTLGLDRSTVRRKAGAQPAT
jgi:transcriptional regulator of acetoin/glycerol metabolism